MTLPVWQAVPQWARALGAVALALLVVYGVARAGGPHVLARDAQPVARIAAQVYCAAASLLSQPATAGSRASWSR